MVVWEKSKRGKRGLLLLLCKGRYTLIALPGLRAKLARSSDIIFRWWILITLGRLSNSAA